MTGSFDTTAKVDLIKMFYSLRFGIQEQESAFTLWLSIKEKSPALNLNSRENSVPPAQLIELARFGILEQESVLRP